MRRRTDTSDLYSTPTPKKKNSRAKTDAEVSAFLSDLSDWSAGLKKDAAAEEPAPLRPRNNAAPIRNVPTTTIHESGPIKKKKKKGDGDDDDDDDGSGSGKEGRAPSMADFAKAEAMLNGGLAKDPNEPEEDLSVPGASVDVERTLKAMKGATLQEKRWVATREKEKGNELFKAKEFRSAIDAYTLSLTLDPQSAPVHANRAAAYMKLKRWDDAEADCTAALTCEPGYFKALMRRGAVRLETGVQGAEAAALEDLKAAEKIEPDNKELQRLKQKAQRLVTDKYERKTMKRMSITEIEEDDEADAAAAEPPTPSSKSKKGGFSFDGEKKTGKKTPAAASSTTTTAKFGPPPPLRTGPIDQHAEGEEAKNRGNQHFKRHEFSEAAAAYTEALTSMPGMASAYCNRSGRDDSEASTLSWRTTHDRCPTV